MTDNGSGYVARLFQKALRMLSIRHIRTRPYTPKTTDVIDKGFLRGAALFCFGARATARRGAGREGKALPCSFHHRTSVAAPMRRVFGPRGFHPATKRV
jgi:hypothetical protein